MRRLVASAGALLCVAARAFAQEPAGAPPTEPDPWSFSVSVYTYSVPEDLLYLQPTVTADRGSLHLETRYNYEALETYSVWGGYNASGGERLAWEITPMLGVVFGDLEGIAPGYKGSLGWWKLELYSEGEYVFDSGDSGESFFYNWSELTVAPVDWFRVGLVTQRTRVYETEREISRGLLVGFSAENLNMAAYVFDPDDDATIVLSIGLEW